MRRAAKIIDEAVTGMGSLPEGAERHHRMTALVSLVVASRLPLPSSAVESPKEWYIQNCIAPTEKTLGSLVEYLIVDVEEAMKIIKATWMNRYKMVHAPQSEEALRLIRFSMRGADNVPQIYPDSLTISTDLGSRISVTTAISHIGNALSDTLPVTNGKVVPE